MTNLLEVESLRTYFFTRQGVVRAVDGVTFDVAEGETVAVVGESGSGKSITALSIMGLIPSPPGHVVGGAIRLEGVDLVSLDEAELRRIRGRRVGMIFQEPMTSLNPTLSIGLQLIEGMEEHLGLTRRQATARGEELLRAVGVSEPRSRLKQYPHQLSGGMRQRVMIAIALSCEPSLLIADEPTTALDVTIQAQILDLIKKLAREHRTAVVLITHDLGVVARCANRVNVMYGGKIVEQAMVEDLFAVPQHPYTQGLLSSVPRLDRPRIERLVPIAGVPTDPGAKPSGCSFRARCPRAFNKCHQEPPFLRLDNTRGVACWL